MRLARRCGRLRTLVLALEDLDEELLPSDSEEESEGLIARLPALLASGAPALRALQLVLPTEAAEGGLGPLWRALEALPNLASLALGCVFGEGEPTAHMGERIAAVLDDAQVGLLPTCRHAGRSALVWNRCRDS